MDKKPFTNKAKVGASVVAIALLCGGLWYYSTTMKIGNAITSDQAIQTVQNYLKENPTQISIQDLVFKNAHLDNGKQIIDLLTSKDGKFFNKIVAGNLTDISEKDTYWVVPWNNGAFVIAGRGYSFYVDAEKNKVVLVTALDNQD